VQRGARSRLALEEVGFKGRKRRNESDSLRLSEAWKELSGASRALGSMVKTLEDATTALGPDGDPNMAALKQARLALRMLWQRNAATGQAGPLRELISRVDHQLARMVRRNLPLGDAEGALPPLKLEPAAERSGPWRQMTGWLSGLKQKDARSLHREALKLWADDRGPEALDCLEQAAEKAPTDARIQFDLGRLLKHEGYYLDAEWALLEADRLKPDRPAVQAALGDLYAQMRQPEMAIEAFRKGLQLDPHQTDVNAQLGVLYYETGQFLEAAAHLQRALSLDQQSVVARFYLAQISLQENDVLRARFQLGMVAQLEPTTDLQRFGESEPAALSRQTAQPQVPSRETAPLHHWKLPRASGTGALGKKDSTTP
jgi:tetratricopeptide (TPR) repeat protein